MKKIIFSLLSLAFCILPFFTPVANGSASESFRLKSPDEMPEENLNLSAVDSFIVMTDSFIIMAPQIIAWIIVLLLSILLLAIVAKKIIHFFNKNTETPQINDNTSWKNIMLKLIFPLVGILGYFSLFNHLTVMMCDCFSYRYKNITFDLIAIIFFSISLSIAYSMRKRGKEWKFLYTLLVLILSFVTFFTIIEIGEYFYVPKSRF